MGPLDQLVQARRLPLGHYDRAQAQRAITHEYAASRRIETYFLERWRYDSVVHTWQLAADISAGLTRSLGTRPIKRILPFKEDDETRWDKAGHYEGGRVIRCRMPVSVCTLIHETAHHVVSVERLNPKPGQHRGDFLWVLQALVDHALGM